MLAVRNDDELGRLLCKVIIAQAGVRDNSQDNKINIVIFKIWCIELN